MLVSLTEVALVYFAVAESGSLVLRCFLVGTLALVAIALARPAIFAALFDTLAETGVESGLSQLERATEVAVTILVATDPILITVVVVSIPTISVATYITFGLISIFERFTEVAAVEFAVTKT